MKNTLLIIFLSLSLYGCTMNPSKEARIQYLESKVEQTLEDIKKIETSFQTLQSENAKLQARVLMLEQQ